MGNQGEVEIEASLRDRRIGTLRKKTPQLERQPGTPDRTRSVLPEGGVVKANCGQGLKPPSEYSQRVSQGQNPNFPDSSDVRDQGVQSCSVWAQSQDTENVTAIYDETEPQMSPGYNRLWPVVGMGHPRERTSQQPSPPPCGSQF